MHLTPLNGGVKCRVPVRHGKTRMVWLPNGEKILKISLFILTECTNVRHTPYDGKATLAQHRTAKMVKITILSLRFY